MSTPVPLYMHVCAKMLQSCLTLCDPMDHSLPDVSVHGILQARTLEWVAIPFSRVSSQPKWWILLSRIFPHWQMGYLPLVPPGRPPLYIENSKYMVCVVIKVKWNKDYIRLENFLKSMQSFLGFAAHTNNAKHQRITGVIERSWQCESYQEFVFLSLQKQFSCFLFIYSSHHHLKIRYYHVSIQ